MPFRSPTFTGCSKNCVRSEESSQRAGTGRDAGIQHTSLAFTAELRDAGILGSIGLYKTELIDRFPGTYAGRAEVENETAKYVSWFNEKRLHSSIGNLSPVEYEQAHPESHKSAATNPVAAEQNCPED